MSNPHSFPIPWFTAHKFVVPLAQPQVFASVAGRHTVHAWNFWGFGVEMIEIRDLPRWMKVFPDSPEAVANDNRKPASPGDLPQLDD